MLKKIRMKIVSLTKKESMRSIIFIFICILTAHFIIHTFTGMWWFYPNPYNSYVLQAQRWLCGHLDLGQSYPYLEIVEYGGEYFISFPPFLSYVMLPFVLIFWQNTPDGLIALASALIGAVYIYKLFIHFKFEEKSAIFWTLFTYIGSNMLFVTTNAWVWFIAQNMCFTLSAAALYYAVTGRGGISLALWACSVGCRPINAIYIVILLYLLIKYRKEHIKPLFCRKTLLWLIAPFLIAVSYMALNYARFDSVFEFGHNYLPEFIEAEDGQFSINYIAHNLPLLFKFPEIKDGIWQYPKFNGMMFFLVTPVFIAHAATAVKTAIKDKSADQAILYGIPVLIAAHFLFLTMHRTMGGYHFGNRYTLDALPFSVFALAYFGKNIKHEFMYAPLMLLGLCMNLVGTIAVYNNWI